MGRPGRPRKYGIGPPVDKRTISIPSTFAHNSAHGFGDEQEHTPSTQTPEHSGDETSVNG